MASDEDFYSIERQRLSFTLSNYTDDGNGELDTFRLGLMDSNTFVTVARISFPALFRRELKEHLDPNNWCGDSMESFDGLEQDLLACIELVRQAKAMEAAKAAARGRLGGSTGGVG